MRFLLMFLFFILVTPAYGDDSWIGIGSEPSSGFYFGQGFNDWQMGDNEALEELQLNMPNLPTIESSRIGKDAQDDTVEIYTPENLVDPRMLPVGEKNTNAMKNLPSIGATGLGGYDEKSIIEALLGSGDSYSSSEHDDFDPMVLLDAMQSGEGTSYDESSMDELIKAAQDGDMGALQLIMERQQSQKQGGESSYNFDMLSPEFTLAQEANSANTMDLDIDQVGIQTSPKVQAEMGLLYAQGEVFPKDMQKAAMWYSKAANQGDALGQYLLAGLYAIGSGVDEDKRKALTLYNLAASQGLVNAQLDLGLFHILEKGDYHNRDLAIVWLSEAADQGNMQAATILNDLLLQGATVFETKQTHKQNTISETELVDVMGGQQNTPTAVEKNLDQNLDIAELDTVSKLREGAIDDTKEKIVENSEENPKRVDPLEGINPTFLLERGFGTTETVN